MSDISAAEEANYPEALEAMLSVMRRPTFTFLEIYTAGDDVLKPMGPTCYRWADRLLQRARKAGQIASLPGRRGWVRICAEGET